jgi:cytochrome P450
MLRLLQRLSASPIAMRAISPIAGSFHPWHPDVRRDPYPTWRRLRETAPLVRVRLLGAWAAGRYADVERILRAPCFSTDRSGVPMIGAMRRAVEGAPDLANLFDHNLLMIDGAKHARLRGLVSRAFTPRRVLQLRGRVEALVAELLALCALLLTAGSETTVNLIGNAVLLLLRHPGERKRLQDDLSLLPSAIEECLRYEPPVQLTDRAVVQRCEIGGIELSPGQLVAAVIAAANRDPERFPDAERFDVARQGERNLSFGLGSHYCLGASLARLEAEAVLGGLLRRYPDFRGEPEPPAWRRSAILRGPASVPIRLG